MSMICCTTTIGELGAYTDGELTAEEELVLRRHLKECPACQQMTGILVTLKEAVTSSIELYPLPRALRVVLHPRPQPQRWSLFSWGLFLRRGVITSLLLLALTVEAGC
jgi:anti-sigma factor RsiW